ncbi:hypothetical protein T492DRAFT_940501 [Pavlovales sp. CCMP2436]|nr:hypothetical protein T492DRAFT_940501 [Pavlovales sp. CCMP2436]
MLARSNLLAMARSTLAEPSLLALLRHAGSHAAGAPAGTAASFLQDERAQAVLRVWAALQAEGEPLGPEGGGGAEDGGGGVAARGPGPWGALPADGDKAEAEQAARAGGAQWQGALAHVSERTVWVDSWVGGADLLAGGAGLRTLAASLRTAAALGAGWRVASLEPRPTAQSHVLTCAGVALRGGEGGSCVPFRATFQFERGSPGAQAASPGGGGGGPADAPSPAARPTVGMAAIAWDVLGLSGLAPAAAAAAPAHAGGPSHSAAPAAVPAYSLARAEP